MGGQATEPCHSVSCTEKPSQVTFFNPKETGTISVPPFQPHPVQDVAPKRFWQLWFMWEMCCQGTDVGQQHLKHISSALGRLNGHTCKAGRTPTVSPAGVYPHLLPYEDKPWILVLRYQHTVFYSSVTGSARKKIQSSLKKKKQISLLRAGGLSRYFNTHISFLTKRIFATFTVTQRI